MKHVINVEDQVGQIVQVVQLERFHNHTFHFLSVMVYLIYIISDRFFFKEHVLMIVQMDTLMLQEVVKVFFLFLIFFVHSLIIITK